MLVVRTIRKESSRILPLISVSGDEDNVAALRERWNSSDTNNLNQPYKKYGKSGIHANLIMYR